MSHVSAAPVTVKDLAALKTAIETFPELTFVEGQKTHGWWGTWANDYDTPDAAYNRAGIDPKTYGKCDHAIKVAGTNWEIGVVKRPDGKGYALVYDFYGPQGRRIQDVVGKEAVKLTVQYNKYATMNSAKRAGYFVHQTKLPNGEYDLILQKA